MVAVKSFKGFVYLHKREEVRSDDLSLESHGAKR